MVPMKFRNSEIFMTNLIMQLPIIILDTQIDISSGHDKVCKLCIDTSGEFYDLKLVVDNKVLYTHFSVQNEL